MLYEQQQLQQLISNDLPSLTSYYLEVSLEKGPGVLVVHQYPDAELVQHSARFLKKSQVPGFVQETGLAELQVQFDAHNPQTQMVMAVMTKGKMGVFTVEVDRPKKMNISTPKRSSKPKGFGKH